jgi:hypothetical protein
MLLGLRFKRLQSTQRMRIGTKVQDAILATFRNHNNVTDVFAVVYCSQKILLHGWQQLPMQLQLQL